jgi:hypothetical protein
MTSIQYSTLASGPVYFLFKLPLKEHIPGFFYYICTRNFPGKCIGTGIFFKGMITGLRQQAIYIFSFINHCFHEPRKRQQNCHDP